VIVFSELIALANGIANPPSVEVLKTPVLVPK
jgi:hypothetical protein